MRQLQDPGLASGKFALVFVHPFTVCGVIYFLHNASKSVQVNFIASFCAISVIYFLDRQNTRKFSQETAVPSPMRKNGPAHFVFENKIFGRRTMQRPGRSKENPPQRT
jgi:hypothetical protein